MGQNLFDVLTMHGKFVLPAGLQDKVVEIITEKVFRRGSRLLKPGQINDKIWFVQSGLLRGYSIVRDGDKEVDVTSWFRSEGEFAVSIPSFYRQLPSPETIEAFEETSVLFISYQQFRSLCLEFMEFNFVRAELLEDYLIDENSQNRGQRKMSAEQRFDWLVESRRPLLERVPDKYLASYLGITPETFSKVKKAKGFGIKGKAVEKGVITQVKKGGPVART